jgi:hypothetical protein
MYFLILSIIEIPVVVWERKLEDLQIDGQVRPINYAYILCTWAKNEKLYLLGYNAM